MVVNKHVGVCYDVDSMDEVYNYIVRFIYLFI